MKQQARQQRHEEITTAAYGLLESHGYGGTTMLRVAQAAKASNETLYRWYGDKDGLFATMVRDNAAETRTLLNAALDRGAAPLEALSAVAPILLRMLTGDRAVLLNRAAAADPSGRLGAAISAEGRDVIQPLLAQVMAPLCATSDCDPARATGWFVALLVGDLQIRRAIGDIPAPSATEIADRARQALADLQVLIAR